MNRQLLSNIRVLVTRPQHQAQAFIDGIEMLGGIAFHLPTIEIVFSARAPVLADADLIIFTSVNSVIGSQLHKTNLPGNSNSTKLAAIGKATTNALHEAGLQNILSPEQNGNSESLLNLLVPHIFSDIKIIIVRGDSGRDTLHDGLRNLGALVRYEEVYARALPNRVNSEHTPAEQWQLANPHVVSVSSDLGLENLIRILPDHLHPQLLSKPLVVNSERCKQKALNAGFRAEIVVASPPGDEGQLDQLTLYAQSKEQTSS